MEGLGLKFFVEGKKIKAFGESESLLQTLDENGKTGLYVLEPHHQRLKRIAEFIIMALNLGMSFLAGKGKSLKNQKKLKAPGGSESLLVKHLMKLAMPKSHSENLAASGKGGLPISSL